MAKQRTSSAFFFITGVPALLQASARLGEHPLSGWFYMSAISGVVLVAMGVWVQRMNQASAAGDRPGNPQA